MAESKSVIIICFKDSDYCSVDILHRCLELQDGGRLYPALTLARPLRLVPLQTETACRHSYRSRMLPVPPPGGQESVSKWTLRQDLMLKIRQIEIV